MPIPLAMLCLLLLTCATQAQEERANRVADTAANPVPLNAAIIPLMDVANPSSPELLRRLSLWGGVAALVFTFQKGLTRRPHCARR